MLPFNLLSLLLFCSTVAYARSIPFQINDDDTRARSPKVLILGGGVAGIIAARTLRELGISDFLVIEAGDELGGRLKSKKFGSAVIELGANWLHGYGPGNPIYALAIKHGLNTSLINSWEDISTYDETGSADFADDLDVANDAYSKLVISAGDRVTRRLHDASARTGFSMTGYMPETPHEMASEYYLFDYEYAQKPDQTSWYASSWAYNYTFDVKSGGFSNKNHLCIDQRGFKSIIHEEAKTFLRPENVLLNSTVKTIAYSPLGVEVVLTDGSSFYGEHAIVTFSLGVLQSKDVLFKPPLPAWKMEGIYSMKMATFTKIFLRFPYKFWFDTETALYADSERGRYPVWQSLDHPNFIPGSGILFTVVTGDFSERIESLSNTQVRSEIMSVLSNMYPRKDIPAPLDFYFERWHKNPRFYGSYSNWPPSFLKEWHENLKKRVGRVWFAGEHTSAKHFGFLHGAYIEGQDVATEVERCIVDGCLY